MLLALSGISSGFDNPITTLGNGNTEGTITFPYGGGTNTDLNLTIPEDAIITDAAMEISGHALTGPVQPYEHDYQDTVNNNAWNGMTTQNPPTSTPTTFMTTVFTGLEYTQISLLDNIKAKTSVKGLNNYPYHLFRFNLTETGITSLDVYWKGYGYFNGFMLNPWWSYGFVWNSNSNTWLSIGTNNSTPVDHVMRFNSFNPASDYVDANGHFFLMVEGTGIVDASFGSDIYTDYTKLETLATGMSLPSDPSLDIGDDGDTEWSVSGTFSTKVVIDDSYNFKSELQSFVDAAPEGIEVVEIPLKLTSSAAGKLKISNISISYEIPQINLPPYLPQEFPNGTFGFYEDTTGGDDLIDLNDYFWDDRDNGSLLFSILKNDDKINAELDADGHHLDFSSEQDYFGIGEFQVRAFDKGIDGAVGGDTDLYTDANTFTVTVWPTNDAPVIDAVGSKAITTDQTELELFGTEGAQEDEWFNLTISGFDIDGDTLSFTVNQSWIPPAVIDIMPDAVVNGLGHLSILATNEHVGLLNLNVTVTDNNETGTGPLTDSINLKIEVQNTNDLPKLDLIPDQIGFEDAWLNFTITAPDDDLIHGDSLVFSTNITDEIVGLNQGENFEFDKNTGKVSILPDNEMVGTYFVEFEVEDIEGITDTMTVNVIINNVNDLPVPVVTTPLHQEAFNTTTMVYFDAANSTDDDLIHGDSLSYLWSSNFDDSLSTDPQFATTLMDIGWHNFTLTVKDSENAEATTTFSIKIAKAAGNGDGPGPGDDDPGDDDPIDDPESDEDDNSALWMGIMILAVIIVVVVVAVLFVLLRRRKLIREIEQEMEQDQQLPAPVQPAVPFQPMMAPQPQMMPLQQPPLQMPVAQPLPQPPQLAPPQPPQLAPQQQPEINGKPEKAIQEK